MEGLKGFTVSDRPEIWDAKDSLKLFTHCPVDDEWDKGLKEVYKIKREEETVIFKKEGVALYPSTLRSLRPGKCISGDIIEVFMRTWRKNADVPVVCFSTFFMSQLCEKGNKMTKQQFQPELSDMDNKLLLVPCHMYSCHWSLYTLDLEQGVIVQYDSLDYSLKANAEKFGERRLQYMEKLCVFFEDYRKSQEWHFNKCTPMFQENNVDCGIYVLIRLFSLMFGLPISGLKLGVTSIRRALSYGIWDNGNGYMHPAEEVPMEGAEEECTVAAIVCRRSSPRKQKLVPFLGDDKILGVASDPVNREFTTQLTMPVSEKVSPEIPSFADHKNQFVEVVGTPSALLPEQDVFPRVQSSVETIGDQVDRLIHTLLTLPEPDQMPFENPSFVDHIYKCVESANTPSALLPEQDVTPPVQSANEPECVKIPIPLETIDLLDLQLGFPETRYMVDFLQEDTSIVEMAVSAPPEGPVVDDVLVDTHGNVDMKEPVEDSALLDVIPLSVQEPSSTAVELISSKISDSDQKTLKKYNISYQDLIALRNGNTAFVDYELGKEYTRHASSAWDYLTMTEVLKALGDDPWGKIAKKIRSGSKIFHKWQESYKSASTPFSFRYQKRKFHSKLSAMLREECADLRAIPMFRSEKRSKITQNKKSPKQRAIYWQAMSY